jgi:hypothetical protein
LALVDPDNTPAEQENARQGVIAAVEGFLDAMGELAYYSKKLARLDPS